MPSPSATDFLTAVQYFLSFAGLVAIGKFLFDWISNYANKQRELRELDKEVRTAQRELIDGQKALREMDKELLTKQLNLLQEQFQIAEKELESTSLTVRQLRMRNALFDASGRYLRKLWEIEVNTDFPKAEASFQKGILSLVDSGSPEHKPLFNQFREASSPKGTENPRASGYREQKAIFNQFMAGLAEESPPEDPALQPAYWMGLMQAMIVGFRSALESATSIVPFVIEEFDRNPDQPLREIFKSYAESQRAKGDQLTAKADAEDGVADDMEKLQSKTDAILQLVLEAHKLPPGSQKAQNLVARAYGIFAEAQELQKLLPGNQESQDLLSATDALLAKVQEMQRLPPPDGRAVESKDA